MVAEESSDEAALPPWGDAVGERLLKTYPDYRKAVWQMLSSKFSSMSVAKREDISQVAFERTARKWLREQLGEECDPLPYALRVARNLAVDSLREKPPLPMEHTGLERVSVPRGKADEGLDVVIRAIREMAPTQSRKVVEMQSGGADDDAISAELGIPRKQVQVQRSKAVRYLRQKLRRHIRFNARQKKRGSEEGDSGE